MVIFLIMEENCYFDGGVENCDYSNWYVDAGFIHMFIFKNALFGTGVNSSGDRQMSA